MCRRVEEELDRGCALLSMTPDPKTTVMSDATDVEETATDQVRLEEESERVRDEADNIRQYSPQRYWDAITQEELPADLTSAARQ